jgi:hypothetical protein
VRLHELEKFFNKYKVKVAIFDLGRAIAPSAVSGERSPQVQCPKERDESAVSGGRSPIQVRLHELEKFFNKYKVKVAIFDLGRAIAPSAVPQRDESAV